MKRKESSFRLVDLFKKLFFGKKQGPDAIQKSAEVTKIPVTQLSPVADDPAAKEEDRAATKAPSPKKGAAAPTRTSSESPVT